MLPVIEVACRACRGVSSTSFAVGFAVMVPLKKRSSSEDANTVFQNCRKNLSHVPVGPVGRHGTEFIGEPEREEDTAENGGAAKEPVFANAEELLREQRRS